MTNADYITAEERYSRTLTKFKFKKFMNKHKAAIFYGALLFGSLFPVMFILSK